LNYQLAKHDDIPAIINMKQAMFEEASIAMGASTEQLSKFYHNYYDEKKAFHYILTVDELPVAMAGGFLKMDFPYCLYPNPTYGFVGDVFVMPEYRRQGHARILSNKVIQHLKQQGVDTIRLLASDAAKPLYQQLGFEDSDMMVMKVL